MWKQKLFCRGDGDDDQCGDDDDGECDDDDGDDDCDGDDGGNDDDRNDDGCDDDADIFNDHLVALFHVVLHSNTRMVRTECRL